MKQKSEYGRVTNLKKIRLKFPPKQHIFSLIRIKISNKKKEHNIWDIIKFCKKC